MKESKKDYGFSQKCYLALERLVHFCYPKVSVEGIENLPKGECVVVSNHCHMYGPILGELFFPGEPVLWCAHQMMELKEVPAYAFEDFWRTKPKCMHWFYKILSYIIAPIAVWVFNNGRSIAVYHDGRIISTFKKTVETLQEGKKVLIFPEWREPHNHIINRFQDKFIEVARTYYKKTGKELQFVPSYFAPKLGKIYIGKPVTFDSQKNAKEERAYIADYLMEEITKMAVALPEHVVVPYDNKPKKYYNTNKVEIMNEKTSSELS